MTDEIDFRCPDIVAKNAAKGLELHDRFKRGGTEIGLVAGQVADVRAAAREMGAIDDPAGEPHLARAGREQAGEHAQQRRLAGAVAAAHEQRLAGGELEVERAEHRFVVAREGEPAGEQQRGGGGRRVHSGRQCYRMRPRTVP